MITADKARRLRGIIERAVVALALPPDEAIEATMLYPEWQPEAKKYAPGDRVQHAGKLWECYQAHDSQSDRAPGAAVSLWGEITVDASTGYDDWHQPLGAHDAYNKGDRVVYKGSIYESTIDGNAYSPEAYPDGWRLIEG